MQSSADGRFALWQAPYPAAGVRAVLDRMAELATRGAMNPDVRGVALQATEHLPSDGRTGAPDRTDRRAVAGAVYSLVVENIEYVHDAHGVEQLQSPAFTLAWRAGDCDDMAVLCAALLSSLGVPVRFKAIGTDPAHPKSFTHVYAEYQDRTGRWYSCDPVADPGVDAEIAPGRVTVEMTRELHEEVDGGGGGPESLAIFAGNALSDGLAGVPDVPTGAIVNTEKAALRLVKPSEAPDQTFFVDLELYRALDEWFGAYVSLVSAWTAAGQLLGAVTVDANRHPWHWEDYAHATARLVFPEGFSPADGPVVFQVHEATSIEEATDETLVGESQPVHLTDDALYSEPFESWWGSIGDNIGGATDETRQLVSFALKTGMIAAVSFAGVSAWPYVKRLLPKNEEEE